MSFSTSSSNHWKSLWLKLACHGLLFSATLGAFHVYSQSVLRRTLGPSTASQIRYDFETVTHEPAFDAILLGNSRIYRGLNPTKMGGRVFNFAHDGDGYNQDYYKLLYLQRVGRLPTHLLIGIDYFNFSVIDPTRRELYQPYFPAQFGLDYDSLNPPKPGWGTTYNEQANLWVNKHFTQVFPLVLQGALSSGESTRSQSPEGQYRILSDPRNPKKAYVRSAYVPFRRNSYRTPMMVGYFERLLGLARQLNLKVALVMPPCNIYEQAAYSVQDKADFWDYVHRQAGTIPILDFEKDPDFTLQDYMDDTHLKVEAADRFTEKVKARLGWF